MGEADLDSREIHFIALDPNPNLFNKDTCKFRLWLANIFPMRRPVKDLKA